MEEKVFYKMLEIPKHCTDEELKKAYYRAAKKYHPDFCSNEQATKMFSDISITYKRILEQRKKKFSLRKIFNAEPVDDNSEIYTNPPEPGTDIHTNINMSLKDSILGSRQRVLIYRTSRCGCTNKNGEPDINCPVCYGLGTYKKNVNIDINTPANIRDGQTLKLTGKGNAGDYGAVNGDLIIHVTVIPDKTFFVKNNDIYIKKTITFPEAVLGLRTNVPTIYGDTEITIPPGIKPRTKIRIPEMGLVNGSEKGDEYAVIYVDIPKIDITGDDKVYKALQFIQKNVYNRELPILDKCVIS